VSDMPTVRRSKAIPALRSAVAAGEAVRDGIATHAEKHKKANEDAHHKASQAQKLSAPLKKTG
jgi:hypothetical protein